MDNYSKIKIVDREFYIYEIDIKIWYIILIKFRKFNYRECCVFQLF